MAAYAFSWLRFPFRDSIFLIVVALLLVPVQVAFIPLLTLFKPLRADQRLRARSGSPIRRSRCRSGSSCCATSSSRCPRDLIEAARIDGAGEVGIFRTIVVPLSVPAIAAYGIFQFLWVWNDLLMALVFVQDPSKFPMTRAIQNLLSQYGTEWHLLAAGAFLLMVVPLLVFFALQRFFVQGLLAGSVK